MNSRRIYTLVLFAVLATITVKLVFWGISKQKLKIESTEQDSQKNLYEKTSRSYYKRKPLLAVFTTFKEIGVIPHHQLAYNIVLSNWLSFLPHVQPILFLNFTNSKMAQKARASGWDVFSLTKTNDAGTPFLAQMYQTVHKIYDPVFYGHANGDILFDDSLVSTLLGVERAKKNLKNRVLVTGRRTDVNVDLKNRVTRTDFNKDTLSVIARQQGTLKQPSATDYFFFSKSAVLNWTRLVGLVIGRPGYDNYMIADALQEQINVIDSTETLLAVHLSQKGVSSHGSRNKDSFYNVNLFEKSFKRTDGFTTKANFQTHKDVGGNVFVSQRFDANRH